MAEQTAQDREQQEQNIAVIKARRKGVMAKLNSPDVAQAERDNLVEELQSIDANLASLGVDAEEGQGERRQDVFRETPQGRPE